MAEAAAGPMEAWSEERVQAWLGTLGLDDTEAVRELLARFDAGKARCYLDKDREKLLAVIEAGFGTFAPFNRIVRGIFAEKG